jgi:hypothetical protein
MTTIGPELASVGFAIALAGFGAGIGLTFSQLGNVVMSSVPESRSSEGGGLQGVAQNLGQSLGTALIGAVLLTGLTTTFVQRVNASESLSQKVKTQVAAGSNKGIQMVSQAQAEQIAKDAGLSDKETAELLSLYSDSQIRALKNALLVASGFVLVGFSVSRRLPGEPLQSEPEPEVEPIAVPA